MDNNNNKIRLFFCVALFAFFFECHAQKERNCTFFEKADRLCSKVISENKFSKIVDYYSCLMAAEEKLIEKEYINIIKIYNTMGFDSLFMKNKNYVKFRRVFEQKHLNIALNVLEFKLIAGMDFYSPKHNMSFSGLYGDYFNNYILVTNLSHVPLQKKQSK